MKTIMNDKRNWIPEIYYEEGQDSMAGQFPFVQIPQGKDMPAMFFILGSKETGDTTPNAKGEEEAIVEMEMYSFVNMQQLQEVMDEKQYDDLRVMIGLKPLYEAREEGSKISKKMKATIEAEHNRNLNLGE